MFCFKLVVFLCGELAPTLSSNTLAGVGSSCSLGDSGVVSETSTTYDVFGCFQIHTIWTIMVLVIAVVGLNFDAFFSIYFSSWRFYYQ